MFVFLEKGLMMAIARVSSFDFTTPESMRNALQRYREEREKESGVWETGLLQRS